MDREFLEKSYRSMHLIRRVEEVISEIYHTDAIKSPVHLSIGQEAVSVGVCEALSPEDVVFGTYRGHALYLAKGGDLNGMMAELFGKAEGVARGKAGSMHLVDRSVNMMGTSAIVASTIPHAVGYALAAKVKKTGQAVVVFFGDGATEEGVFHESLNFAALKELPILFVCENNKYAIYTDLETRVGKTEILDRVRAYQIPARRIDAGSLVDTNEAARAALGAIRKGEGPQFLECMTYRWRDHVGPGEDRYLAYRPDEELDDWIRNDEVAKIGGMIDPDLKRSIEEENGRRISQAMEFAEKCAFPDDGELLAHVFKD